MAVFCVTKFSLRNIVFMLTQLIYYLNIKYIRIVFASKLLVLPNPYYSAFSGNYNFISFDISFRLTDRPFDPLLNDVTSFLYNDLLQTIMMTVGPARTIG